MKRWAYPALSFVTGAAIMIYEFAAPYLFRAHFSQLVFVWANVIAVILAGMATFLWKGMRPRLWWLEERASKRARAALAVFMGLFVALAIAVVLARELA